jgi:hypothetical protein
VGNLLEEGMKHKLWSLKYIPCYIFLIHKKTCLEISAPPSSPK